MGIVIYRLSHWVFYIVQKPWNWAHILVQKPQSAGGGVIIGQSDTHMRK